MSLWTISAAAKAAGVRHATLRRWLDRKAIRLKPGDRKPSGPGVAAGFTRDTIQQIAVIGELAKLNIPPSVGASHAIEATTRRDDLMPGAVTGRRWLIIAGGRAAVRSLPPDGDLGELLALEDSAIVVIDISKLTRRVDERLKLLNGHQ